MTKVMCIMFLLVVIGTMFLSGCTTIKNDPVATGEVIGITYILTKDQLSETDRENIENAYHVFSEFLSISDQLENGDIKGQLYAILDLKVEDPAKRAATKVIITLYWDKLVRDVNMESLVLHDQIEVLKQVKIGIERGLGV